MEKIAHTKGDVGSPAPGLNIARMVNKNPGRILIVEKCMPQKQSVMA
ncbi:MAG: hypothetical protein HN907_15215 [Nitrospina sp.]|nr:hypothetical protein [Nitrospina sp.]